MRDTNNILVTGGAGYIGSHACKALAAAGYEPVTYDNFVYGHEGAVRWGPAVKGELCDRPRLDQVFEEFRPKAVMHFAAFSLVGESVSDPGKYYRNNVLGSLTLFEAMRDHGVDNLVFSSTCATYGEPQALPISDDHPQNPVNPYGASKFMVERIARDFGKAHGLRSIFLRYFNAAGADPDCESGEDHDPETHLIPLVLEVAAGKRPHIAIFGTDYDTPDGTCLRDYIHVSDLADAHVLALKALEDGAQTMAFNLGNGRAYSVREVIETARAVTGRPIPAVEQPRRPGDPAKLVADAAKAQKELGWVPKMDDLSVMIETAWKWLLKTQ